MRHIEPGHICSAVYSYTQFGRNDRKGRAKERCKMLVTGGRLSILEVAYLSGKEKQRDKEPHAQYNLSL